MDSVFIAISAKLFQLKSARLPHLSRGHLIVTLPADCTGQCCFLLRHHDASLYFFHVILYLKLSMKDCQDRKII